jgi:hypothetical protein
MLAGALIPWLEFSGVVVMAIRHEVADRGAEVRSPIDGETRQFIAAVEKLSNYFKARRSAIRRRERDEKRPDSAKGVPGQRA